MARRHTVLRRTAAAAALAGLLAGCGTGAVEVHTPSVTGAGARACATLVGSLPRSVDDQQRRTVSTSHGYAAAWGDPAIVLRCGVPRPKGLNRFASCQQVNGVGWFVPPAQINRGPGPIVMTTIGFQPRVQVRLPGNYWPPAAAMADLAKSIRSSLQQTHHCV